MRREGVARIGGNRRESGGVKKAVKAAMCVGVVDVRRSESMWAM